MKSSPAVLQDASDDDIFGPPRTYTTSYYSTGRQRPTMISAKYRQKEERRKVLKISVNKLRKIEDPENSLCRSVLINNTMKRLQRESKEEKLNQCQQMKVRSVDEFAKLEPDTDLVEQKKFAADFANFHNDDLPGGQHQHQVKKADDDVLQNDLIVNGAQMTPASVQRKRSIDDVDDCDVQDVLSQFYMPPTPRMLTSIDDDEDLLPEMKRGKYDLERPKYDLEREELTVVVVESTRDATMRDKRLTGDYVAEMKRTKYEEEPKHPVVTVPVTTASSFSCGHSSIFNDLQSNVFHSLVASLET